MDPWLILLLPFAMVLGRVTAFLMVLPVFGFESLPIFVRMGVSLVLSLFLGSLVPAPDLPGDLAGFTAGLLLVQEILLGLALGLVARLIYLAVQQGVLIATQQMGLADAEIIDPATGESTRAEATFFEMAFLMLFLSMGGHLLLIRLIAGSYEALPPGQFPEPSALAGAMIEAGSSMLGLALRLAAPMVAAFLILAVVLGVVARALPEMNVLFTSLPLRVGLGLLMCQQLVGYLDDFTTEIMTWMSTRMVF